MREKTTNNSFVKKEERKTIRKPRMAELNETAEAKQKLQELKEKMLALKEHL